MGLLTLEQIQSRFRSEWVLVSPSSARSSAPFVRLHTGSLPSHTTCSAPSLISGGLLRWLTFGLACPKDFIPPLPTPVPTATNAAVVRPLDSWGSALGLPHRAGRRSVVAFDSFRRSDVSDFFALACPRAASTSSAK